MPRTKHKQVALYLRDERIEQLKELAHRLGKAQQDVLRDAVEAKLRQHRLIGGCASPGERACFNHHGRNLAAVVRSASC